jgi:hypothetical protein
VSRVVPAFSHRLPGDAAPNRLSRRLQQMRAAGARYVDLTESNPTCAGFDYPDGLLAGLAARSAHRYEPIPCGLECARQAIARDHGRRGTELDPRRIVLCASTSEAYGWLFKLLCDPGDQVLVPQPSYPLFEHLTRLEAVRARGYRLEYDGAWHVDFGSLEAGIGEATRAVLVVSPNNPTGSFVRRAEWERLAALCAEREIAIIADEVFVDYPLEAGLDDRATDLAVGAEGLVFTLGGLSKSIGLPQVKLAWIVAGGRAPERALSGLELIADSYLSVSTPVQLALADLLERGAAVRRQIQDRVRRNLLALRELASRHPACELLRAEGGWSAVIRVPALASEEDLVLDLLEHQAILVYPGYFFDFPREAYLVVSLLPPPSQFADAVARLLHRSAG